LFFYASFNEFFYPKVKGVILALGFISKQESYILKGSDCTLSKAYGLPKIHKVNVPFRDLEL